MQPARLEDAFPEVVHALRLHARAIHGSRIPSALGRQPGMPRQAHQRYRPTLEDRLCFHLDVAAALARLPRHLYIALAATILSGATIHEGARALGTCPRTLVRQRRAAIERLSRMPAFRQL